ncbi:hypothetical protein B0T17DRAFT_208177 [Bombardia bombarda]|uniref:BTB domain-containing protein n=1 Tax=Bombardia bombarda TaxID=252184 RepID=A0AA40CA17_9PEZI|nr:hypothetical protein B0T17DRAFT_208177 [Bombardia bombarda]
MHLALLICLSTPMPSIYTVVIQHRAGKTSHRAEGRLNNCSQIFINIFISVESGAQGKSVVELRGPKELLDISPCTFKALIHLLHFAPDFLDEFDVGSEIFHASVRLLGQCTQN